MQFNSNSFKNGRIFHFSINRDLNNNLTFKVLYDVILISNDERNSYVLHRNINKFLKSNNESKHLKFINYSSYDLRKIFSFYNFFLILFFFLNFFYNFFCF